MRIDSLLNPKVSIIIPVFNGANYLAQAIESALYQSYKNIEVIVVNDGSNDGGMTDEICKKYGNKIRYLKKENGGVASALNIGIEAMEGEYFSWLSHDDVYNPNKIEEQIVFLSKLKDKKTVIFSDVEYIDENNKTISKTNYEGLFDSKCLDSGCFCALKGIVNGCSLLIHKSVFKKVGLFNESYLTSNDYDLWFRIFKIFNIKYLNKVLIKYRLHKEQGSNTFNKNERVKEADLVWNKAIIESKGEISLLNIDLINFYIDLANRMKLDSRMNSYFSAKKIAKHEFNHTGPYISVVMPCYNAEEYIAEAIESIINQTFANFELIIVDDASTDKSHEIMNKFGLADFRIRIYKHPSQKGAAACMNTGISQSRSKKYLTRADADDISLPERFEKQVEFLDTNPEYGFCSTNLDAFGDYNKTKIFEKKLAPLEWLFLFSNPMASATTMYRMNIIKQNNLLFKNYKVACDYDFLCRFLQFSKPYMLYDESLYKYRIHSGSLFQQNKKEALENSIIINNNLLKSLTKKEVPYFHKYLTSFASIIENNDFTVSLDEIWSWIVLLVDISSDKWGWGKEEVKNALQYSDSLIKQAIIKNETQLIETEYIKTKNRLSEIDKMNIELYKEKQELLKTIQEKDTEIDKMNIELYKEKQELLKTIQEKDTEIAMLSGELNNSIINKVYRKLRNFISKKK